MAVEQTAAGTVVVVSWLAIAMSLVGVVASVVRTPRRPPVAQAKV